MAFLLEKILQLIYTIESVGKADNRHCSLTSANIVGVKIHSPRIFLPITVEF
jgi:hypothetical protein